MSDHYRDLRNEDQRDQTIATLRADLARVTAERDNARDLLDETLAAVVARSAQVRELQKVARAAAAWKRAVPRPMFNVLGSSVVQPLWDAVTALPPSMLEESSDG